VIDGSTTAPQRILFIGGLGRSGSTLIEKLLNELPATFAVGETIHLWERGIQQGERCGCGEAFERCPHWSQVGDSAFGGWDRVDLTRIIGLRWSVDRSRRLPRLLLARRRSLNADERDYLDHLRSVLLAGATAAGSPAVLLESSKHLSTAALLSLDPALDVRVLHLIRDPRGVAYSWTKEVARPEARTGEIMPIYRPSRTALRWVTDNLGFRLLARLGVPTLRLRYEDVLADPRGHLERLTEFAGIPTTDTDLDFLDGNRATLRTPMHSIAGNPLRFGGSELTLRVDDAWKTKLDRRSRAVVTAICLPVLRPFGYSVRG
jgi:hypothetical protein